MGAWEGYVQGIRNRPMVEIGVARMESQAGSRDYFVWGDPCRLSVPCCFSLPAWGFAIKTFHIRFEQQETFSAEAQKPVTSTKDKKQRFRKGAGGDFESGGKRPMTFGPSGK